MRSGVLPFIGMVLGLIGAAGPASAQSFGGRGPLVPRNAASALRPLSQRQYAPAVRQSLLSRLPRGGTARVRMNVQTEGDLAAVVQAHDSLVTGTERSPTAAFFDPTRHAGDTIVLERDTGWSRPAAGATGTAAEPTRTFSAVTAVAGARGETNHVARTPLGRPTQYLRLTYRERQVPGLGTQRTLVRVQPARAPSIVTNLRLMRPVANSEASQYLARAQAAHGNVTFTTPDGVARQMTWSDAVSSLVEHLGTDQRNIMVAAPREGYTRGIVADLRGAGMPRITYHDADHGEQVIQRVVLNVARSGTGQVAGIRRLEFDNRDAQPRADRH